MSDVRKSVVKNLCQIVTIRVLQKIPPNGFFGWVLLLLLLLLLMRHDDNFLYLIKNNDVAAQPSKHSISLLTAVHNFRSSCRAGTASLAARWPRCCCWASPR